MGQFSQADIDAAVAAAEAAALAATVQAAAALATRAVAVRKWTTSQHLLFT